MAESSSATAGAFISVPDYRRKVLGDQGRHDDLHG